MSAPVEVATPKPEASEDAPLEMENARMDDDGGGNQTETAPERKNGAQATWKLPTDEASLREAWASASFAARKALARAEAELGPAGLVALGVGVVGLGVGVAALFLAVSRRGRERSRGPFRGATRSRRRTRSLAGGLVTSVGLAAATHAARRVAARVIAAVR